MRRFRRRCDWERQGTAGGVRPTRPPFYRDGEIDALTSTLAPLADGAFIFGPSGAGKTTLACHVVDLLERENLALTSGYVNAMSNASHA